MFLKKLLAPKTPSLSFSADLAGDEADRLLKEMRACIDRQGGAMKNARRAQALADLFLKLSPSGQNKFAGLLDGLNEVAKTSVSDRYSQIEEAEMFGRSDSKLAVLDMFETPRRRLLNHLFVTENGPKTLAAAAPLATAETAKDIEDVMAAGF